MKRPRIAVVRTVVARRVVGWVRAVTKLDFEEVRSVKALLCSTSLRKFDAVRCAFDLRLAACWDSVSVTESLLGAVSVGDDDQNLGHGMLITARFQS